MRIENARKSMAASLQLDGQKSLQQHCTASNRDVISEEF
jgi:hypothetical protein